MKLFYLFTLLTLLFSAQNVFAINSTIPSCTINTTALLKLGSKGADVECLQAKVGAVRDGSFGPLTNIAVKVFQSSNGLVADGIVGPLSRVVFNAIKSSNVYPAGCTSDIGYSITTGIKCDNGSNTSASGSLPSGAGSPPLAAKVQPPKVFSVSPEKVRSGDTVKIYGENFSPTGNTVRLRYGQIEDRFENLSSNDGKIISFVFQPPEVKTMNKAELLSLPSTILNQILDPIKARGGSIDDIVAPYRNMKNESDLQQFLNNNGHSFDELYDKFYVTIENVYGRGSSGGAILMGLRKLSFGSSLSISEDENSFSLIDFLRNLFAPQKAYAQLPEGGYNSGIIMYCTCGSGYLTVMTDVSTNGGSGLYWWPPGFVPTVGTSIISGPQLGFFIQSAGVCVVGFAPYCSEITANIASLPWGEGL